MKYKVKNSKKYNYGFDRNLESLSKSLKKALINKDSFLMWLKYNYPDVKLDLFDFNNKKVFLVASDFLNNKIILDDNTLSLYSTNTIHLSKVAHKRAYKLVNSLVNW